MLTIKPIGSTSEEVNYYAHLGQAENHDYYSEDGNRPGVWWGQGAKALGLEGKVDPGEFENLLQGLSPDGTKALVQQRNGSQLKRRAGFDFTFSEVKSYDALWALASETRKRELEAVAEKALGRVLEVVQDLCGATRRGKNGILQENAQLIGAIFHHDTARPIPGEVPDPNKHHHVVIANVVVREDGTTGALDARPVFQRRMKMAIGALFRTELSMLLETELGIVTYRPKRDRKEELVSWFEIQGVPTELMRAMSKRRVEIEKWLRQHGLSGAKASEKAALRTRQGKERFTWEQLRTAWEKMGQEHGFTREKVEALFGRLQVTHMDKQAEGKRVVARALESLIEQKARFSENELLERTATEAQTRGLGIDDILGAVKHLIEHHSELVQLQDMQGVRAFTTKAMLELEQSMLETVTKLHNRDDHSVAMPVVNKIIQRHKTIRPDQARAVRAITTGSDITVITGIAGSGKTFMLSICREILERAGYSLWGTSLASKASKGLEKESGIKSLHIHKLLHEIDKQRIQLDSKSILIVDEAGMVGTVHMERLASLVYQHGAKLVMVGDHQQLQATVAGAPHRAIGTEIGTTEMNTIVRQREPWARDMVLALRNGEAGKALAELYDRGQLIIEADREEAMERLVADWSELIFEQGEKIKETLVLAGMNVDVRELNRRIQEKMIEHQQLGNYSIELDGLNFHLGDQIMITKNYNLRNLQNGTMAEVVGIEKERMWILTEEGLEMEINTKNFSDITLSYAMSVHKAQGITCENVFVLTGDAMTDREFAYVSGSRPRGKTIMYSDEISVGGLEQLAAKMNVSRQKEMAYEHLLEGG